MAAPGPDEIFDLYTGQEILDLGLRELGQKKLDRYVGGFSAIAGDLGFRKNCRKDFDCEEDYRLVEKLSCVLCTMLYMEVNCGTEEEENEAAEWILTHKRTEAEGLKYYEHSCSYKDAIVLWIQDKKEAAANA